MSLIESYNLKIDKLEKNIRDFNIITLDYDKIDKILNNIYYKEYLKFCQKYISENLEKINSKKIKYVKKANSIMNFKLNTSFERVYREYELKDYDYLFQIDSIKNLLNSFNIESDSIQYHQLKKLCSQNKDCNSVIKAWEIMYDYKEFLKLKELTSDYNSELNYITLIKKFYSLKSKEINKEILDLKDKIKEIKTSLKCKNKSNSLIKYRKLLEELIYEDKIQNIMMETFIKGLKSKVDNCYEWIDKNPKGTCRDSRYDNYNHCKSIINKYSFNKNKYNDESIRFEAIRLKDLNSSDFIDKNTNKLSNIFELFKDDNELKFNFNLSIRSGIIVGYIDIIYKNISFSVKNQLVYVPWGERIAHYRFPTTFHDLIHNGTRLKKMISEEKIYEFLLENVK